MSHSNVIWLEQPAADWNEALPLGNGRLGAMVFGSVGRERLQLNEDTLWSGEPMAPPTRTWKTWPNFGGSSLPGSIAEATVACKTAAGAVHPVVSAAR